jgi:hypothetical protein
VITLKTKKFTWKRSRWEQLRALPHSFAVFTNEVLLLFLANMPNKLLLGINSGWRATHLRFSLATKYLYTKEISSSSFSCFPV